MGPVGVLAPEAKKRRDQEGNPVPISCAQMPAKYPVIQERDHLLSSNGELEPAQTQTMDSRARI